MSVREYIGARYMPVFADPIEWDITLTYEPLTVIKYQGTSYVSRRSVPEGIQVTNEDYWVRWADYNAQLEEYIRQVNAFDGRIDALEEGLPVASFSSENTVDGRFKSIETRFDTIEDVLPISEFDSTNTVDARFDTIEANSWVTTDRIANSAVTSAKIADGAVTSAKIADGTIDVPDISQNLQKQMQAHGDIILIGDSYLDGYSPDGTLINYGTIIQNWLANINVTVYKKSLGGTGFAHAINGVRFAELLEQLANTMTQTQKDKVTLIIAAGGYNDCYQNADIALGMTDFKEVVDTHFKNAAKVVAPFIGCVINTYASNPAYYFTNVINGLLGWMSQSYTHGISCVNALNTIKDVNFMSTDYVHPNQTGQNRIAQLIYSIICGVKPTGFNYQKDFTLSHYANNREGSASAAFTYMDNLNNEFTQENVKCFKGLHGVTLVAPQDKELTNAVLTCKVKGEGVAGLQGSKQTGLVHLVLHGYTDSAKTNAVFEDVYANYHFYTADNAVYVNFHMNKITSNGKTFVKLYGIDNFQVDWGSQVN